MAARGGEKTPPPAYNEWNSDAPLRQQRIRQEAEMAIKPCQVQTSLYQAPFGFTALEEGYVSLKAGEIVIVTSISHHDIAYVTTPTDHGWVPTIYLEKVKKSKIVALVEVGDSSHGTTSANKFEERRKVDESSELKATSLVEASNNAPETKLKLTSVWLKLNLFRRTVIIRAADTPQLTWSNAQCRDWVTEVLVEYCSRDREYARGKADRVFAKGGFGPRIYNLTKESWRRYLGVEDGQSMFSLVTLLWKNKDVGN